MTQLRLLNELYDIKGDEMKKILLLVLLLIAAQRLVCASDLSTEQVLNNIYNSPNLKSGELQGSASAIQMPNIPCNLVKFKAEFSNTGGVYIGGSGVTVADDTTDTTTGLGLEPGDESGWIPVPGGNLNVFYRICDSTADTLTYIATAD